MKITENQNELIWTDKPVALKVFGLLFAASGLLFPAIAVAQFLKSGELNLKTFGVLCLMGIAFVLLGLTVNFAFKSTEVTINKLLSRIIYKHGKVVREFSSNEIVGMEQVTELDDEGDLIYRPKLRTRTGEMLPVYRGYVQSAEMDSAIAKFNSFLNKS